MSGTEIGTLVVCSVCLLLLIILIITFFILFVKVKRQVGKIHLGSIMESTPKKYSKNVPDVMVGRSSISSFRS